MQVVLLVTQAMLEDGWSGFLVLQAQCSISDTMPDRVLVLLVDQLQAPAEAGCPTHVSTRRLLRMVPESSVYQVPRHATRRHSLWRCLAEAIARD